MNTAEIKSQGTVLKVEHTPHCIDTLLEYLHKKGLKTLHASDGTKGIIIAEIAKPDVILLEFMMPGMNGFEVYQILQSKPATKNIPVIFFARGISEQEIFPKEILEMEYFYTPIQWEELWERIKKHL